MPKLTEMEKRILSELQQNVLPEVAAINLGIEPTTLYNYVARVKRKCIKSGEFLKDMQKYERALKLKITIKIETERIRKV